jgi:murein DD-endopeptidase MepM/ murein hydrolase activator NlpD
MSKKINKLYKHIYFNMLRFILSGVAILGLSYYVYWKKYNVEKLRNEQQKALLIAIDDIRDNRPAIGGLIQEINNDIDNQVNRKKDINNLADTDYEIMIQERILNNGLNKYSMYKYSYPVFDITSSYVTCEYGDIQYYYLGRLRKKFHMGIDIGCRFDSRIKAVENGIVVGLGFSKYGYGNFIKLQHEDGNYTLYAHLDEIRVKENEKVFKGQFIGIMGSTGNSIGKHLHYEIRDKNNKTINPVLNSTYGIDVESKRVKGVE